MSTVPQLFIPVPGDAEELATMGAQSFFESHHTSASRADIDEYIANTYTPDRFREELNDLRNVFVAAKVNGIIAGYAKLVTNASNTKIASSRPCKMERLYVLENYLPQKIGQLLFDSCVSKARELHQTGIWLNTWTGNPRAIRFYTKQGFSIAGETMFRISATHSNPNYLMWLPF